MSAYAGHPVAPVGFLSPLRLQALSNGRRQFQLIEGFETAIQGERLTVPAGFITDFASVPRAFQNVIENDDPDILQASVLHDFLYSRRGLAWQDKLPFTRAQCDAILREGMAALGASEWRRWTVWLAVRLGGWIPWHDHASANEACRPGIFRLAGSLLGIPRSARWRSVREEHLKKEPWCRGCGHTSCLEVHHVSPVHITPRRELDPSNLITLCEHPSRRCHLMIGHFGNWAKWNPNVRKQAVAQRPVGI